MKHATTLFPMTGKPVLNDRMRLLFDWDAVRDSSARAFVQPIEGKYWMNQARTRLKYIDSLHWALMLLLPCEQFVKESDRNKIWDDTAKQAMEIAKEYEAQKDAMPGFEKVGESCWSLAV